MIRKSSDLFLENIFNIFFRKSADSKASIGFRYDGDVVNKNNGHDDLDDDSDEESDMEDIGKKLLISLALLILIFHALRYAQYFFPTSFGFITASPNIRR